LDVYLMNCEVFNEIAIFNEGWSWWVKLNFHTRGGWAIW